MEGAGADSQVFDMSSVQMGGKKRQNKNIVMESVSAVTGDKSTRSKDQDHIENDRNNVIEIKRLAGL